MIKPVSFSETEKIKQLILKQAKITDNESWEIAKPNIRPEKTGAQLNTCIRPLITNIQADLSQCQVAAQNKPEGAKAFQVISDAQKIQMRLNQLSHRLLLMEDYYNPALINKNLYLQYQKNLGEHRKKLKRLGDEVSSLIKKVNEDNGISLRFFDSTPSTFPDQAERKISRKKSHK